MSTSSESALQEFLKFMEASVSDTTLIVDPEEVWVKRKQMDRDARGSKQNPESQAKTISLIKSNSRIRVLTSDEIARMEDFVDPLLVSRIKKSSVVEDIGINFKAVCTRVDAEKASFGELVHGQKKSSFPQLFRRRSSSDTYSCHPILQDFKTEEVSNIGLSVKLEAPKNPISQKDGKSLNGKKVYSMLEAVALANGAEVNVEWDALIQLKDVSAEDNSYLVPEKVNHPKGNTLGLIMAVPNRLAAGAQKLAGKLYSLLPEEVLGITLGELSFADMLDTLSIADYAPDLNDWAESECSHLECDVDNEYDWLVCCLYPWTFLSNQNIIHGIMEKLKNLYSSGNVSAINSQFPQTEKMVKDLLQQYAVMHLLTRKYKHKSHEGITIAAKKWRSMAADSYIKKMAISLSFSHGKVVLDLDKLKELGATVIDVTPINSDDAIMDLPWIQDIVLDGMLGKIDLGSDVVVDNGIVFVKARDRSGEANSSHEVVAFEMETLFASDSGKKSNFTSQDLMAELINEVDELDESETDVLVYPRFIELKPETIQSMETAQAAGLLLQVALTQTSTGWKFQNSPWWPGASKILWKWLQEYRFEDITIFGTSASVQVVDGKQKRKSAAVMDDSSLRSIIRASDVHSLLSGLQWDQNPIILAHTRGIFEEALAKLQYPKFTVTGPYKCWIQLYREEELSGAVDGEYVSDLSHTLHVNQCEFSSIAVTEEHEAEGVAVQRRGEGTSWLLTDEDNESATLKSLLREKVVHVSKKVAPGNPMQGAGILGKKRWMEFGALRNG